MLKQPEEDEPSAEEGLKFITFFLKAYQEENDAFISVDSKTFNETVLNNESANINLVFEKVAERVIIRTVVE